jgi:cytidylate kinase
VIAIYGESCAGKSSVARELGLLVDASVRHCGELAKQAAARAGVKVADLPRRAHEELDSETRKAGTRTRQILVVEGTFLDHVLREARGTVLVKLDATFAERTRRLSIRTGTDAAEGELVARDAANAQLRETLYGDQPGANPSIVVDTEGLDAREIARNLAKSLLGYV